MISRTTCPAPSELRAFVADSLGPDEWPALAEHLEHCAECQQRLQDVAADSDTWKLTRRHLRDEGTPSGEGLQRAVAELTGRGPDTRSHPDTDTAQALDFLVPSDQPGCLGRLAHYTIHEIIGRGGMGVVLKAFDEKLRRTVAIKVLVARDTVARARFQREARALAKVHHEHVIDIYAVEEFNGLPFIVMEYLRGNSLQERLDQDGPLESGEAARIGIAVATGLAAAHEQGLVHRDVKPANILVEEGTGKVKLTDFGLARNMDGTTRPPSGEVAGTPPYMAPEQARGGAVDYRADLFSLGSVLYALCTGRAPFLGSGGTTTVLREVHQGSPRPVRELNPQVPVVLAAIIAKLHAVNPADRYGSAAEVAEALRSRLAELSKPAGRLRRHRWLLAAAAVVVAAGCFMAWMAWPPPRGDNGPPPAPPRAKLGPTRVLIVLAAKDFFYPDYIAVRSEMGKSGIRCATTSWAADDAVPIDVTGKGEGEPVPVELVIEKCRAADYDAIYFCGGRGAMEYAEGGTHVREARRLIAEAQTAGIVIAALGTGPVVLAEAGVLRGRRAACYQYGQPMGEYIRRLQRGGATWVDEPFEISGPFLTGGDPQHGRAFARALVEMLSKDQPSP